VRSRGNRLKPPEKKQGGVEWSLPALQSLPSLLGTRSDPASDCIPEAKPTDEAAVISVRIPQELLAQIDSRASRNAGHEET